MYIVTKVKHCKNHTLSGTLLSLKNPTLSGTLLEDPTLGGTRMCQKGTLTVLAHAYFSQWEYPPPPA